MTALRYATLSQRSKTAHYYSNWLWTFCRLKVVLIQSSSIRVASSLTNSAPKSLAHVIVRRLLDKDWHLQLTELHCQGASPNISIERDFSNLIERNISLSKVYDAIEQVRPTIPVEEALCLLSGVCRGNWNELEILLVRIIVDRATEFDMNAVVKSRSKSKRLYRGKDVP